MPGRRNVVECIVGLGLLTPARYTVYEGGSDRVIRGVCSSERGVSSEGSAGGRLGAKVFTRNKVPRVMDMKAR